MKYALKYRIVTMVGSAGTQDQLEHLLLGWDKYFFLLNVEEKDQEEEFASIIRARAFSGSISLIAPTIENLK